MRITREMLLKLAQDAVDQRARADRGLVAAYLSGSLLGAEPLLGGTTDIDLYFVYSEEVAAEREVVKITDEVHYDLTFHARKMYRQTRDLRVHPWLGPTLYGCKILYDPQHFMDFVQASVRGQFERADMVMQRVQPLATQARQIWMGFSFTTYPPDLEMVRQYLSAVGLATNAIAGLKGHPLSERRFLLDFPARAEALGRGGLARGLFELLGGADVDAARLRSWQPLWISAWDALPDGQRSPRLSRARSAYYQRAVDVLLDYETPAVALWPMLWTWLDVLAGLPAGHPAHADWQKVAVSLSLWGDAWRKQVAALDAYLDFVEETLEIWGRANGA